MNQLRAVSIVKSLPHHPIELERVDCRAEALSDVRRLHQLHDSVVQSLYSVILLAEGWRRMAEAGQVEQAEYWLAEMGAISRQTLCDMRLLGCLLAEFLDKEESARADS